MDYPEEDKGKCRTCGLLAKHPTSEYAGLPILRYYEIDPHTRERGSYSHLFRVRPDLAGGQICDTNVVCFIKKADLMEGVREIGEGSQEARNEARRVILAAIAADRHCAFWYPYTPGFSPIEHYGDLKMQQLEHDRRQFETRLFEMEQQAQRLSLEIAEDSKGVVSDLREIARKNDTFSRRITFWVVLLALVQALGTILTLPSVPWVQRLWRHFFG